MKEINNNEVKQNFIDFFLSKREKTRFKKVPLETFQLYLLVGASELIRTCMAVLTHYENLFNGQDQCVG